MAGHLIDLQAHERLDMADRLVKQVDLAEKTRIVEVRQDHNDPQVQDQLTNAIELRDALVVAAVMVSSSAVEGRVNEMLVQLRHKEKRIEDWAIQHTDDEFMNQVFTVMGPRPSTKDRIRTLYAVRRVPLSFGQNPFQSWKALTQLRNALVHLEPVLVPFERDSRTGIRTAKDPHQDLVDQLDRLTGGVGESGWAMIGKPDGPAFPRNVMTPVVARWAASTARKMVTQLDSDIGIRTCGSSRE